MTDQRSNSPIDALDPYEARLWRRVGSFSEQAVLPIDATAIAASIALGARRRTIAGRLFGSPGAGSSRAGARLALIGAGAVLVAAGAFVIGGGARGLLAPAPTANENVVTIRTCTPYDVDAVITAWDGAAGHRIATVELHQIGPTACGVEPLPQPWLAAGHGDKLIVGHARPGAPLLPFEPGAVLHTLVQVGNYCGPTPEAPVTLAFTQEEAVFVATALSPKDLSGVPPCSGTAGPTDDIQMQPWTQGPATP